MIMVGGRALDRSSTMHGEHDYGLDLKRKRGFLESLEMGVIKSESKRMRCREKERGREGRERKRKVTLSGKG